MISDLTNAEIIGRFTTLADNKSRAISGTTTSLISSKLKGDEFNTDEFKDYYICFLSGEHKGIDRFVISYDDVTGAFTFDALNTPINNTSEFALVEDGFLTFSTEAINFITEVMKNEGRDIDLFLTPSQLKELHLYKTLDLICQDRYHDADSEDMYYNRHLHYKDLFDSTFASLKADYDSNENGIIEEEEKLQGGSFRILGK